ncbi:MAG: HEAT repeat domain-containing protein [Parcubacteria group bacterium]|nr:HEAT repeat domain-containing protein [Parcubacteria group bacterium]
MKHKSGNIIVEAFVETCKDIKRKNKIIPKAARLLKEGGEEVKWTAVKILGEISTDKTTEILLSALETESFEDIKISIIEQLSAHLHEEKVSQAIILIGNDPNPLVREKVREVLQIEVEFNKFYGGK